jgi:hypothetical protein
VVSATDPNGCIVSVLTAAATISFNCTHEGLELRPLGHPAHSPSLYRGPSTPSCLCVVPTGCGAHPASLQRLRGGSAGGVKLTTLQYLMGP